jgi:hypothetical protein
MIRFSGHFDKTDLGKERLTYFLTLVEQVDIIKSGKKHSQSDLVPQS